MKQIKKRKILTRRNFIRTSVYGGGAIAGALAGNLAGKGLEDIARYATSVAKSGEASAQSSKKALEYLKQGVEFYMGLEDHGAYEVTSHYDTELAKEYKSFTCPENKREAIKQAVADSARQSHEMLRQVFDEGLVALISGSNTKTAKDLQSLRSKIMAYTSKKIREITGSKEKRDTIEKDTALRLMKKYQENYNTITHALADYILELKDTERKVNELALDINLRRLKSGEIDQTKVDEFLLLQRHYVEKAKEKVAMDKLPMKKIAFESPEYTYALERAEPVIENQKDRYGMISRAKVLKKWLTLGGAVAVPALMGVGHLVEKIKRKKKR